MTMEKRTLADGSVEIRSHVEGMIRIEKRAEGEPGLGRMIGYAAVFEKWSNTLGGWFQEMVARGAFDGADMSDVVCVFNHDENLILSRTNATLYLIVDEVGLRYEFDIPDTTAGRDLATNVTLKNVRGSSFRFIVKEESWQYAEAATDFEKRTIVKFEKIIDVSPVVFPAYPDTSVAKRSHDAFKGGGDDEAAKGLKTQIEVEAQARQRKLTLYK